METPIQPPAQPPLAMDDSHFLGSIMERDGAATSAGVATSAAEGAAPVKRKRGRPPKNAGAPAKSGGAQAKSGGAPAMGGGEAKGGKKRKREKEEEEEVVCFICFDGGNLVVCDKRGCPKVYHPVCIHRDESFFKTRGKWNCGWHICSMCQKNSQFMCYTCTYSSCKGCLKNSKFFRVRGNKGFCDTCFGTIVLIEDDNNSNSNNLEGKIKVDFDDKNSWEYLFKLYWVELRDNISLTIEELKTAKEKWDPLAVSTSKTEFSDDSYDLNSEMDASSDGSSGQRKKGRKKRGRKGTKNASISSNRPAQRVKKGQIIPEIKVTPLPDGAVWATPDLLEFVGHMRDGNKNYVSQFDVQALVLDYIKKNNLRDPRKKSQIVCDTRLLKLFGKPKVGHFEMLSLIDTHFLIKETSNTQNNNNNNNNNNNVSNEGNNVNTPNLGQVENEQIQPDTEKKKRRRRRKGVVDEKQVDVNIDSKGGDYAAVDMHNLGLIYLKRGLAEELVEDSEKFKEKILGAFVRIRIPGVGQKQDMYRLVKVVGTSKAGEKYKVGKKMTEVMLEILNLDKKETITVDAMSNQDFSEEECKRLRQSMKCGRITPLKLGEVQEKAKSLQSLRINEVLENEKQRLTHLRDRASETGRRKELRECVEKLQMLNTPDERERRLNEVPAVHSDPHMDPGYQSPVEPAKDKDKPKPERSRAKNNTKDPTTSTSRRKTREPKNPTISPPQNQPKSNTETGTGTSSSKPVQQFGIPQETATSAEPMGGEKVWHYRDPTGNIQGPFSIAQLAKWSTYFPKDLRVWLMIESEDSSLPLTDILPKNLRVSSENASGSSSSAQNVQSNAKWVVPPNCASAVVPDPGKAVQANINSNNSIKEYGTLWSPTKPNNLGSGSANQQSKPTQPKEIKEKQVTQQSANLPNNIPSLPHDLNKNSVPTPPPSLTPNLNAGTSTTTTTAATSSVPPPPPPPPPQAVPTTLQSPETLKPKEPKSSETLKSSEALKPKEPKPSEALKSNEALKAKEPKAEQTLKSNEALKPKDPKAEEALNPNPSTAAATTSTARQSETEEADESWPEVQVHESAGVEHWVPDPTTTSLETGSSYPSDCLSPADILLSLSRVADEDLEDGDFLARMEALKKKSRLGDREFDLSVDPAMDAGDKMGGEGGKTVLGDKLTWDKMSDPLGADWALPSPTPLGPGKPAALGIDTVSTSGNVAESLFISGGPSQRSVQSNPEPMLARTTYVDLNTSLQGSIGGTSDTWTNHLTAPENNTGVTWSNNADVSMTSNTSSANWMDMNQNVSEGRPKQANTGVTWSTLSGSSPPAQQPKPKPYNSWAETMHQHSASNVGWAGVQQTNSSPYRSGWGQPAMNHHVNPNNPSPNPNPNPNPNQIQEQRKEVVTDANASWGTTLALGNNNTHNTQNNSHWDGSGGMDWASQWNNATWHGNGSQSRSQLIPNNNNNNNNVRGQAYQRVICKFHENGYCKKGASCNYLHP